MRSASVTALRVTQRLISSSSLCEIFMIPPEADRSWGRSRHRGPEARGRRIRDLGAEREALAQRRQGVLAGLADGQEERVAGLDLAHPGLLQARPARGQRVETVAQRVELIHVGRATGVETH